MSAISTDPPRHLEEAARSQVRVSTAQWLARLHAIASQVRNMRQPENRLHLLLDALLAESDLLLGLRRSLGVRETARVRRAARAHHGQAPVEQRELLAPEGTGW